MEGGLGYTFPAVVYEPDSSLTHQPEDDSLAGSLDTFVCECIMFPAEGITLKRKDGSELVSTALTSTGSMLHHICYGQGGYTLS